MNLEQLRQLRATVEGAGDLPAAAKDALLKLVTDAQDEAAVEVLDQSEAAEANESVGRLMASVQELEASHPEATAFMNRVATVLGNMGI